MVYYLDQQTFPHPLCLLTVACPLEPEKEQLYFLFTSTETFCGSIMSNGETLPQITETKDK